MEKEVDQENLRHDSIFEKSYVINRISYNIAELIYCDYEKILNLIDDSFFIKFIVNEREHNECFFYTKHDFINYLNLHKNENDSFSIVFNTEKIYKVYKDTKIKTNKMI